ncbi:MAG: hypothetical protein J1E40_07990 [Oscillospiraceae bacterium]|nr:hypothetical protein [Oscillospiraceae bacterium]
MMQVNMIEAKADLSKLVKMLENKEEDVIYIEQDGIGVAQITLIPKQETGKRIGAAVGKIILSSDFDNEFDSLDDDISYLFEGDGEV